MGSMVTRCPACGTRFKVVADQLRISQGWVRCGRCAEVFDATQALGGTEAEPQAAPGLMPPPVAMAEPEPRAPQGPEAPTLVDVAPQWLPQPPTDLPVTDPATALEPGYAAEALSAGKERLVVALAPQAAPLPRPGAREEHVELPSLLQRPATQAPRPAPAPARVVATPPPPPPLDPEHADLSFLREAPAPAPAPPAVRALRRPAGWWMLAALALLVLLAQWMVHDRDRLGAAAPAMRPVIDALCRPFGCRVQPLRRIDAVVIDGSSFHAQADGGYRLSLTLRNRAAHAVALPALALSLTDITEQPVVRRVLLPAELGQPPEALGPHGEWTTSVDLQMADNAGRARVVGYRLDAFYP